ncbi:outer membrane beta-barrel family protein [Mucilaginibacter ginkgonis]|uniref:TonB-dependent receptor n=1 Tax=Mucilaginibacter ginkgonis TaxID=2682091 RepID=A0A6I4HWK7_9SPHI|nr:outer membrane beta-barrel family protein [Mucilaginibacter ginkgonis]QQL51343.1 TonB-dependent receptor [Mucilaginibacter ginkgonis]
MKRIILLFAIISLAISAKAQMGVGGGGSTITGRISGVVIDSISKKPLDYATVSIFRSGGKVPLNGVLTDSKGSFKLDNVKAGKWKIVVSFIGYPNKTIDPVTTTLSKPDMNIGEVVVAPSSKTLNEVKVTGQKALIENHIDKIVFNAEKDITSTGGNASDVLQKVPLVAVDINGNVSVRGDQNVRVLINGKPSGAMSASVSDVLKTIPADQIKSVEVITSPSAKYDAEGSAGIINIITKQKNVSGISGSISGGVGTRQNNGNANINYNQNRFSLSANAGGNFTWPQKSITTFNQVFNAGNANDHTLNSTSESTIKRYGAIGSVTAGYDVNNYNSFSSTIRLNQGGFNIEGNSAAKLAGFADATRNLSYTGTTTNHNKFGGFDWNLDYTHKFKKEGEELTISGQWSHSIVNTDYLNFYTAVNPNQKGSNDGRNNEYTGQVDYTLPATKFLKIEAGGKTIVRKLNSNYQVYGLNGGSFVLDNNNSNIYDYDQNVVAGYSVLTFTLPKSYSILAGARYENTDIKGNPETVLTGLTGFSQNYGTFIPSLTLQKMINSTNTIKLSYSKRIQRPSLLLLNPFINRANPQSQSVGNPTLAPEVSQTVEFNYNTFIGTSIINASVYYKQTNGLIEGILTPLSEVLDGTLITGTRSTNQNIGQNHSVGGSIFGSVNPVKWLTLRGSINAYTYNPKVYSQYASFFSQTGVYWQYTGFASASVDFGKGFIAEGFGFTNSARRTIQGTSPSFGIYVIGVKKQFWDKKASLGFNTVTPFSENKYFNQDITSAGFSQHSSTAFPFRSFGISFSYNFGKLNFSAEKKKGINNDDIKQGDQNGGAPGGAPSGGR